jgi:hypothetical protein
VSLKQTSGVRRDGFSKGFSTAAIIFDILCSAQLIERAATRVNAGRMQGQEGSERLENLESIRISGKFSDHLS